MKEENLEQVQGQETTGSPSALDRRTLYQTLEIICEHISSLPALSYRLIGTSSALLQGVDMPAGDIDFLVKRREDVDAFSAALHPFLCLTQPVYLAEAQQYLQDTSSITCRSKSAQLRLIQIPSTWKHVVKVPGNISNLFHVVNIRCHVSH